MSDMVRRVVTAIDANGASVFLDEDAPFVRPQDSPTRLTERWYTDGSLGSPAEGYAPGSFRLAPPPGGTNFRVGVLPPQDGSLPKDHGMHTTATIDYGIVISGECWLRLDSGAERHLRAGDCVVQRGTAHTWRNDGQVPCVMAFVMVAALPAADDDSSDAP